jgi:hypothetical protein|tara:strand:+ start:1359 stop:1484 length:126 start_codon:yes stop_codon:yes gene_type:complete
MLSHLSSSGLHVSCESRDSGFGRTGQSGDLEFFIDIHTANA